MAKLVFGSVHKVIRADWLLNGRRFYDVGPAQYAFSSGPVSYGGKILELILMKF